MNIVHHRSTYDSHGTYIQVIQGYTKVRVGTSERLRTQMRASNIRGQSVKYL